MADGASSLLHDGTYRAYWLRMVIKSPQITDSIRVLLMTLALYMDPSGRVSVPRELLASLLGRTERKVGDKVKQALESGLLLRVVRGQKGRTAVFQAAVKGVVLSVIPGGPAEDVQGDGFKPPEPDSQGDGFKPPEEQGADFRGTPGVPADEFQGDPRGSCHIYREGEVGDDLDDSNGAGLFHIDAAAKRRRESRPKSKSRSKADDEHPRFAEWYAAYPLHDKRPQAVRAFNKALAKVGDPQILIDGAKRYAERDPRVERGFIKGPAVWLNNDCWNDSIPSKPTRSSESGPSSGGSQVPERGSYDTSKVFKKRRGS